MENLTINRATVGQINELSKTQKVQNVQAKDFPNDSVEFATKKTKLL